MLSRILPHQWFPFSKMLSEVQSAQDDADESRDHTDGFDDASVRAADKRRANALPYFGHGELPPDKFKTVEDDDSGFLEVLALFLRSWPYIRPQFLGRWYIPGEGFENRVADTVAASGFHFGYAPFAVGLVAIAGPMFDFVPRTFAWPFILLYVPVVALVVAMTAMAYTSGRTQMSATIAAVLCGVGTNISATFFIDGWVDGVYAGAVTFACIMGWIIQYRFIDGKVEFRFRGATHLAYFYLINFIQRFIGLAVSVIAVDLLNQALLQGEPLAPGLSELLGLPNLSELAIEELTVEQRVDLLWLYLKIVLGVSLIQFPLRIINPYYNMWIMQRINQDLRIALVERWHQLSISYHSEHRTGDSIFRIYQDSAMVTVVIGHLLGVTLALMSYFSCVVVVTLFSPWIGLLAAVLVLPALTWAHIAMPRVRVRSLAYRAATSDVTSNVQEAFGAIKLIKAFGTSDRVQKKFETDSITAFNSAYRVRALIALVTIVMFTVAATFMITGEFLMAYWATQSASTWAVELMVLLGVSWVVWNLSSFTWVRGQYRESANDLRKLLRDWMTAQDMAMGLRRVFDILDIEPNIQDKPDAVPLEEFRNVIRYENVRFHYEEDRPVLDDVSFSAEPGSITAIIGPTGSGKSTLMALLLRLFDPQSGSISIDGRDLRDYKVSSLRSKVAIALQENLLFAMSVRDNIRYVAPAATDEEITEAIRIAAIDDYVTELPNGLDTVLSDRGGKLSTGQRQRLSIARTVIRKAPILILDEPTAALDASTEHKVMANLTEWVRNDRGTEGRAIFLITHRISTIRQADNILYLEQGRIIEQGSHTELMQREGGRYRSFVEAEINLTTAMERRA